MPLNGVIEYLDPINVRGWAYQPESPDVHVGIRIVLDGGEIGRGIANIRRTDLATAGVGLGDHAFDIQLSFTLHPDQLRRVQVLATDCDEEEVQLAAVDSDIGDLGALASQCVWAPKPKRLTEFRLPAQDTTQRPVFVLGAARSGTSAIAQGLLKSGAYQGFEEGHFHWMLQRFLETIDEFYAFNGEDAAAERFTTLAHVPYTYMTGAVRTIFIAAAAELFPSGKWIDKTPRPEMIDAAKLMLEVWPNARFIFLKRRGIENLISRRKKFPQIPFRNHCEDWSRSMEAWLRVRDLLGSSALEVEQLAAAKQPARTAQEIGQFLSMSEESIAALAQSLESDLPERSADIHGTPLGIEAVGWSTLEVIEFRKTCAAMMAAYNYGFSNSYFQEPVASVKWTL